MCIRDFSSPLLSSDSFFWGGKVGGKRRAFVTKRKRGKGGRRSKNTRGKEGKEKKKGILGKKESTLAAVCT